MEPKVISKIANTNTFADQRTFVTFKNGAVIHGFFMNNAPGTEWTKENKWNFVIQPQSQGKKEQTLIDGNEILDIEVKDGPIAAAIRSNKTKHDLGLR